MVFYVAVDVEMHTGETTLAVVNLVLIANSHLLFWTDPSRRRFLPGARVAFARVSCRGDKTNQGSHLPCGSLIAPREMFLPSSQLSINSL